MSVTHLATLTALFLVTAAFPVQSHARSRQVVASCAGFTDGNNPYAPQPTPMTSVGGPLAAALQGKPVLVEISASWCANCQKLAPILNELKQRYADRVYFVVFDVSDRSATAASQALAKKLGLARFLTAHHSQTGLWTVINPSDGSIFGQIRHSPQLEDFTQILDTALAP